MNDDQRTQLPPLQSDDLDALREWLDETDWDAAGPREGQAANVIARLLGWNDTTHSVPRSSEEPNGT